MQWLTKLKFNLSQTSTESVLHDYYTKYDYQLVVPNFINNESKNWFVSLAVNWHLRPTLLVIRFLNLFEDLGSLVIPLINGVNFKNTHVDVRIYLRLSFYSLLILIQ